MKNYRFNHALVVSLFMGFAAPVFASDSSADLQRDRQRAVEALKDKNPQRAVKLIEPWIKKRPDDIELANDYALVLAQMGKLDHAREVLEDALSKNRESAIAFQNLREILSLQAAVSYAKAINRKPPSTQIALKGGPSIKEPAVVVAQVEPRPGALVEPVPAKNPMVAASGGAENRADAKADRALRPGDVDKASGPTAAKISAPSAPEAALAKPSAAKPQFTSDEALTAALRGWADAWSNRDFNRYLAAYSEKFQPQQFPSRDALVTNRKPRVTRPDMISVKVSEIRIKALPQDQAEVTFRQRYEAGSTKLNSVKTLVWVKEPDGWKILREEGR